MAKSPKPNTTRKPPAPSSHADIEEWIDQSMPRLHPLLKGLDELIRETIPGLEYAVKWKTAFYGLPELGWIIQLSAYDVSVNAVFFGGAAFPTPPPLGEGSRYVKVRTLDEALTPQMRTWIEQAGKSPGWQ